MGITLGARVNNALITAGESNRKAIGRVAG